MNTDLQRLVNQRVLALNHHVDNAVLDQCRGIGIHPYDTNGKALQRAFLGSQVFAAFMGVLQREGWENAIEWLEELLSNVVTTANHVGHTKLTKRRSIKIAITKVDG